MPKYPTKRASMGTVDVARYLKQGCCRAGSRGKGAATFAVRSSTLARMAAILYVGNRNYSSWSLRGSLVVRQSGIDCDEVVIPLDLPGSKEQIAAVSPSRRLPILYYDDMVIWDSFAIAEFLHEKRPNAELWPTETSARARARSVSAEMHSSFGALRSVMPLDVRSHYDVQRAAAVDADIERIVAIWTECRREYGAGGDYLFGRWSVADAMYAPQVPEPAAY